MSNIEESEQKWRWGRHKILTKEKLFVSKKKFGLL